MSLFFTQDQETVEEFRERVRAEAARKVAAVREEVKAAHKAQERRNAIYPASSSVPVGLEQLSKEYHQIPVLPTDSEARKEIPLFSGVLNYFPLALAAVARHSQRGNAKHNPGQPIHWARGKSMDHLDCIARHLLDAETVGPSGEYEEATAVAWRALAYLQEIEEKRLGKPWSRGSK